MKFSVLIPTKNRLSLLRMAVQSVADQDYDDWEIVVSDNASDEPVVAYVEALHDPRVHCLRTDAPITVTDNWNRAFGRCVGDYVIMLGDDDALLPGYMRRNAEVLVAFGRPDVVFVQGVQYAYPGVMPGRASAFVQVANCEFLRDEMLPFVLDREQASRAVKNAFGFRVSYPFNMQYFLVKREAMLRLAKGDRFYRSPYPDYYAANLLMLDADRIVVQPVPLLAVGISSKSFGFYYFNNRESEGVDFLKNVALDEEIEPVRHDIVPGPDMHTSWLVAVETAARHAAHRGNLRVKRNRYRFMQFRHCYLNTQRFREFLPILRRYSHWREFFFWLALHACVVGRARFLPGEAPRGALLARLHRAYPQVWIYTEEVSAPDILQFARQFMPDAFLRQYLRARAAAACGVIKKRL